MRRELDKAGNCDHAWPHTAWEDDYAKVDEEGARTPLPTALNTRSVRTIISIIIT